MTLQPKPEGEIAVVPLVGSEQTEAAHWLGALLGKLLGEHLRGAGLPTLEHNTVARRLVADKLQLPLEDAAIQALQRGLNLRALIHGRYVLDEDAKMLGLRLMVEAPDVPRIPLEVASPLAGFTRFMERIALAVIERLNVPVDDSLRQRVHAVPRPASFQAFSQLAQAQAAWAKGQNELALTAITSALALDPDLEEAAAIEVAIARVADDTATTRDAFRRWANIATKKKQPSVAAERLILLGHWLTGRGEWDEARSAYEDARGLLQREEDEFGKAQVLNNLANLDVLRGKYHAAIRTYRRSLRAFESEPDAQEDMAITLFNLALAHKNLGQREEAQQAIEEALLIARRLKDVRLEGRCLGQLGALRDDLGQWQQAGADYMRAGQLLDVMADERGMALVKSHQAILYRQQGAYDRAEALMLEALVIFEREGDTHERAVVWCNLAELYLSMELYDQAWDYAERAHEAFQRLKSGCLSHAQKLLEILKNLPEEPEPVGEDEPPPYSLPFVPSPGESPPSRTETGDEEDSFDDDLK